MVNKYTSIILSFEESVATISLNRPEVYNALSLDLLTELASAFQELNTNSDVRVIILKGEGKGFCSGQDLKSIAGGVTIEAKDIIEKYYKPVILSIVQNNKPVICQLHGAATGAGMALALSCDIVISDANALLVPGFVKIGLVPDSGASWFIYQILGPKRTFEILALGDSIPADKACQIGLINSVSVDGKLEDQVKQTAEKFKNGAPLAISMIKKIVGSLSDATLVDAIATEARYQNDAAMSDDFKEGVKAFLEKRKPVFKGK